MGKENGYWERRIPRRRILKGIALGGGGLAASAVIGCGDDDEEPAASSASPASTPSQGAASPTGAATPAARQPKKGGTFNGWHNPPRVFDIGFDAHVAQTSRSCYLTLIYQGLLRSNARSFDIESDIAQKWELPSPTEFVFHLTPGVKFHNKPPANGREVTAEDVVFSLERVRTNEPRFINRTALAGVDKIEAVDKSTVRITSKSPDVTVMSGLASFSCVVLAPDVISAAGDKLATADTAVGTGALVLQSSEDVSATLVRNTNYWKPNLPYLDSVRLVSPDQQAAWAAFLAKQLDAAIVPGVESRKVFDEQQAKGYVAEWFPESALTILAPNAQKPPFNDPRIPRALRLLVDHQEAISGWADVQTGRGQHSAGLPPALAQWDFTNDEYEARFLEWKKPKDEAIKEALSLLSAAGFNKDKPLSFTQLGSATPLTFLTSFQELVQAQLNKLSQGAVNVTEIKRAQLADLNSLLAKGDFDYLAHTVIPPLAFEPDSWFRTHFATGGGRNYGKYSDATLDSLIDKQRATFDVQQRKSAIQDVLRHLADNAPYTNFSGYFQLNARQPKVMDWAPGAPATFWGYQYEHVWLDS